MRDFICPSTEFSSVHGQYKIIPLVLCTYVKCQNFLIFLRLYCPVYNSLIVRIKYYCNSCLQFVFLLFSKYPYVPCYYHSLRITE